MKQNELPLQEILRLSATSVDGSDLNSYIGIWDNFYNCRITIENHDSYKQILNIHFCYYGTKARFSLIDYFYKRKRNRTGRIEEKLQEFDFGLLLGWDFMTVLLKIHKPELAGKGEFLIPLLHNDIKKMLFLDTSMETFVNNYFSLRFPKYGVFTFVQGSS